MILNSDENIVEKDKLVDYHSSVKVSQMCLKGAKVKIITVDKCFRYLGYRNKLIHVSKHCLKRRNCSLSAIAPFANILSTFVCN